MFWPFSSSKKFDQKLIDLFRERGIDEEVFISFLKSYWILNLYSVVSYDLNNFIFVPDWDKEAYFEYFRERFELIKRYENISIEEILKKPNNIFNPTIWKAQRIEDVCNFLMKEWVNNPISYIIDWNYIHHFFDTSKALDRIKEKYYFLKSYPGLKGKVSDFIILIPLSTQYSSLKTIQEDLWILEECWLVNFFLQEINSFWLIIKGRQKIDLFRKYNIPDESRNAFLRKYFLTFFPYKFSLSECDTMISQLV